MILPFLKNLVQLLAQGPGVTGTYANGSTFTLPDLIMAFVNDGQLAEFSAAVGVFDDQTPKFGFGNACELALYCVSLCVYARYCGIGTSNAMSLAVNLSQQLPLPPLQLLRQHLQLRLRIAIMTTASANS
jgi:hypothetical protein